MSRKLTATLIIISIIMVLLIVLIAANFSAIKTRYKEIEPNIDNYSVAEVTLLAFSKMRNTLIISEYGDYEMLQVRKGIFDSKVMILKNKAVFNKSFFDDQEFIQLTKNIDIQSSQLNRLYDRLLKGQKNKQEILAIMDDMEVTLADLQEVAYRIQIRNFNETIEILADNTWKTEILAIAFLILLLLFIVIIVKNALSLKEIVRDKNIFISSIYHELAGSTQAIIIAADIMEYETEHQELYSEIKLINYHANKIIDQTKEVMDYAKIESGEMEANLSAFHINDVLHDALISVRDSRQNHIKLIKSKNKNQIVSDKYKLYRIIVNLIDNANKYTDMGKITICARLIKNRLYIMVKDNGIGFNICKINQLYKAFNQGAKKETRQGMGLGLTITKNYVSILKGKIRVKSCEGKGTLFLLYIPVAIVEKQTG